MKSDISELELHYLRAVKDYSDISTYPDAYYVHAKSSLEIIDAVNIAMTSYPSTHSLHWHLGDYDDELPYYSSEEPVDFEPYDKTEMCRIFVEANGQASKERGGVVLRRTDYPPRVEAERRPVTDDNVVVSNNLDIQELRLTRNLSNYNLYLNIRPNVTDKIYTYYANLQFLNNGSPVLVIFFNSAVAAPPAPVVDIPLTIPVNGSYLSHLNGLTIIFYPAGHPLDLSAAGIVKMGRVRIHQV